jgi:hypothetical protein
MMHASITLSICLWEKLLRDENKLFRVSKKGSVMEDVEKPMTLTVFAENLGIGIFKAKQIARQPGFPLLDGLVFMSDYQIWRRKFLHLDKPQGRTPRAADISDEPVRLSGSRASLRSSREPLREAFAKPL